MEKESFKVNGKDLLNKVKELIDEGNVRRITIINKYGKELLRIPLTVGIVGALLLPVFAIVGTIAALVTECTIIVEKEEAQAAEL